jgi:hypothetical protein
MELVWFCIYQSFMTSLHLPERSLLCPFGHGGFFAVGTSKMNRESNVELVASLSVEFIAAG